MSWRVAVAAALALGVVTGAAAGPAGADVHGVPLPARSRSVAPDLFESGQGFRKTVDFYERFLKRRGYLHEAVAVYRHRGVVVARFLARDAAAPWLAIQVFQAEGRTRIAILPARPAPAAAPAPP